MKTEFTAAVNTSRDEKRNLNYILTANVKQVYDIISRDFRNGQRAFSIVGSYGTGKSAFLWALQKSLTKEKVFFKTPLFEKCTNVKVINIVGRYKSLIESFADEFRISTKEDVVENILFEIYNQFLDLKSENSLLLICIDEFGKFLEYAMKNSPEKELYFMQQIAELANNTEYNIGLITTIHQEFESYSFPIQNRNRQEWIKVKGRFREITFNEPIEQLLFLAAEHLSEYGDKTKLTAIQKVNSLYKKSKAFNSNITDLNNVCNKLFPLDVFAANIITLCLQRYGQNERSLFSFLQSSDSTGINHFKKNSNPFYNLSCVYDYVAFNMYSFINSKFNPDIASWSAIKEAIQKAENTFDDYETYCKVIKTVGLLNLFSRGGSILDKDFLINYSETCLGIEDAEVIIQKLVTNHLIAFRDYNKRYVISQGTTLDIQSALNAAEDKVEEFIKDLPTLIRKNYDLPPEIAKEYSYTTGTTRVFQYAVSEQPITKEPIGDIDGYINLIFNEGLDSTALVTHTILNPGATIYGLFRNTEAIKITLRDIEKTKTVIQEHSDDSYAVKELTTILNHQRNLLNHKISTTLYSDEITWVANGEVCQNINNKRAFNARLSRLCREVYDATPIFKNELVNKQKLSSQIITAKRTLLELLCNNQGKSSIEFEGTKFPPERTIYLTLIEKNGLEIVANGGNISGVTNGSSFARLWNASDDFLNSSKKRRQPLNELLNAISKKPFKLKKGFIEFWVPIYLFLRRDDFALFHNNVYVPVLSPEILELTTSYPGEFQVKAFDIDGIKLQIFNSYRELINKSSGNSISNVTFIETIRPFLKFYRELPDYTKQTNRLSSNAIKIRNAILNSTDPENTFYESFPAAMDYSLEILQTDTTALEEYVNRLKSAIKELRTTHDLLVERFEKIITKTFTDKEVSFPEYKLMLQKRVKNINPEILNQTQRLFLDKINYDTSERGAWLDAIAFAVVGKNLDKINDNEETTLYRRFQNFILEFDSLTEISLVDYDSLTEDIIKIQITEVLESVTNKVLRLPKDKISQVSTIQNKLNSQLTGDKFVDLAALTNALKQLLKNE